DQTLQLCEAFLIAPDADSLYIAPLLTILIFKAVTRLADERLTQCVLTGTKRLGMWHGDVLRAYFMIGNVIEALPVDQLSTMSNALLSFVAEGMLLHSDSVVIQLNGLDLLRIIVSKAANPITLVTNAMLHYALDNAVEYHIMDSDVCTKALEIASICKHIGQYQVLQQQISEHDAFLLMSLPRVARQKRDYGRVLEQLPSQNDDHKLEFLMSALRLHGHNKTVAKLLLDMLDGADPAQILPIEDDLTYDLLSNFRN
ncbi:hypothetical protein BVRB_025590, partial [Beta vulgaris subsp. vulgaris]